MWRGVALAFAAVLLGYYPAVVSREESAVPQPAASVSAGRRNDRRLFRF